MQDVEMLIRIAEIPPEGSDVREDVTPDWVDASLGSAGRGAAGETGAFSAQITRVGAKVLVQGRADLVAQLKCCRCLASFDVDLGFDMTHILEPRPEEDGGEEEELDEGDMDVSYIDGPEFDMGEVVREHMHLALPMNPICKPDCAGLCDQCGGDLNTNDCGCAPPPDPRWAGLADIKIH